MMKDYQKPQVEVVEIVTEQISNGNTDAESFNWDS